MDSKLDNEKKTISYGFYYMDGTSRVTIANGTAQSIEDVTEGKGENSYTYNIDASEAENVLNTANSGNQHTANGCYSLTGWYSDKECTKPVTSFDNISPTQEDGAWAIRFYCKRTLIKYRVTIVDGTTGEAGDTASFGVSGAELNDNYYYVNIAADGTASFDITNPSRFGYDILGAEVSGNQGQASKNGDNLTVTLGNSQQLDKTVTLKWSGKAYTIQYAQYKYGDERNNGAATTPQNLVYGDTNKKFYSQAAGKAYKETGYDFVGWSIGGNGTRVTDIDLVSSHQQELYKLDENGNLKVVTLYPVYEYANVGITGVTDNKVDYQYKTDKSDIIITAEYIYAVAGSGEKNGDFTYSITSGGPELGAIGIEASTPQDGKGGVLIRTDGPTETTGSTGAKQLVFSVTDGNAPGGTLPKTFTITITVSPKNVYISLGDDKLKEKTYDGTTSAPKITSPLSTIDENGDTTDMQVVFTGVAQYNSANVSEASEIILPSDAHMESMNTENTANYKLVSTKISGCTIKKRYVYLKTDTNVLAIRAGEPTPVDQFKVVLDTEHNDNDSSGFCGSDNISSLGTITYTTDRPEDLTVTGEYKISAKAQGTSNYEIAFIDQEGVKGKFKVIQEKAELGTNYTISASTGTDGWYIGDEAKILPVEQVNEYGGYDTVYISRDGGVTFEAGGMLKEEDSNNPNLQIYLESSTGAVTTKEPLKVSYDKGKPQYVGYAVDELSYNSSTGIPGFIPGIGGVFDFGTYTRATINVQIEYKDETSGLATLEYGLFGEDVTAHSVPFNQDTGIATITILNDAAKKGAITCRAVDTAGNVSETIRLKPSGSGNDYEWVVEQAAPVCEPLVVYSGTNKDVIVQDQSNVPEDKMAYYNHCQALLKVTDSDSGIHDVVWHINDADTEETLDSSKKITAQSFTKDIPSESASPYTVYATVTDNAGNTYETNKITFKIDDVDPNLVVDYDDKVWSKLTTISFTTSDDLSGVDYAKVTDGDGNTIDCDLGKPDANGVYTASFEATKKGTYSIVVADKAGNTATWTKEITMISDQTPDCPGITVSPDEPTGTNGWYTSNPVVTITNPQKTEDGTPVNTSYRIWKDGESSYNDTPITGAEKQVELTDEGIFNIKAWSKSVSGVECESYDEHIVTVQIDKTAPEISFTTEKGSGSTVLVNFTVTDSGSGVDKDAIKVLHGTQDITAKVEQTDTGYAGSFEISETGNYSIQAADIAGNISDAAAFTPMSMKIKAVTNISDSKATLGANIIKGTFDIASASLSYRKYADTTYTEAEAVTTTDENGNVALSAVLENLERGTAYVFKVTAVSSADEVLEYEGYFKTLSADVSGISVTGTTRYADDTEGFITVGLFEGNVCIMAKEVTAGEEFVFNNVPDGNYTIVATDGTYSKSMRLLIKDGLVVYPESYIELILSGKNTSVVITTDDTPNITADNMDSIFNNDTVNFTETDKTLIEAGGTVEFKLYATLMTVSSVSANEISAMYAVTDKNKVVGAYLDLSLYKIVTDVNGDTERSRVTNLASGASISVTIPLGELAGKPGLEVIRIHNDGENFIGASLADQDNNPDTYTITTNQFSTYAVLYSREEASTEPTTEPTTVPSNNNGTVTTPTVPANTSQQTTTTEDNGKKKIKDKDTKPAASNTSSVGTLKSSGTAKTGDAVPIAAVGFMMLLCMGGFFFLKRKLK
ncbi:MAG: hypothetical protein ACI4A3_05965 [Lachnospiraceae bacterium]